MRLLRSSSNPVATAQTSKPCSALEKDVFPTWLITRSPTIKPRTSLGSTSTSYEGISMVTTLTSSSLGPTITLAQSTAAFGRLRSAAPSTASAVSPPSASRPTLPQAVLIQTLPAARVVLPACPGVLIQTRFLVWASDVNVAMFTRILFHGISSSCVALASFLISTKPLTKWSLTLAVVFGA